MFYIKREKKTIQFIVFIIFLYKSLKTIRVGGADGHRRHPWHSVGDNVELVVVQRQSTAPVCPGQETHSIHSQLKLRARPDKEGTNLLLPVLPLKGRHM